MCTGLAQQASPADCMLLMIIVATATQQTYASVRPRMSASANQLCLCRSKDSTYLQTAREQSCFAKEDGELLSQVRCATFQMPYAVDSRRKNPTVGEKGRVHHTLGKLICCFWQETLHSSMWLCPVQSLTATPSYACRCSMYQKRPEHVWGDSLTDVAMKRPSRMMNTNTKPRNSR